MPTALSVLPALLLIGRGLALEPLPDFQLVDANTNSVRNGTLVSPHDYRLQISAFYFGAAG